MKSALDKLQAILRRDLLTAIRHRTGFVTTMVGLFTELAAFYFLSRAIGPGFRPGGIEYFPFLLVGTGVYTFLVMSTQAFLSTVQDAQQTGTMEVLMTTSTPPAELVVLSSVSAFARSFFNLGVYFLAGAAFFGAATHANIFSCLVVMVLLFAIAMALGIAAATVQVAFQKGSAVMWLLSSGAWLLSGAMFPVDSLPRPLVLLAHALPLTYAVNGMRMALLQGQSILTMGSTLGALLGFSLALLPLTLWALSVSLRRARQNGTLSFY
jgi:ABC-2 type transport system permease protein